MLSFSLSVLFEILKTVIFKTVSIIYFYYFLNNLMGVNDNHDVSSVSDTGILGKIFLSIPTGVQPMTS